MEIKEVPVTDVKPYTGNPRVISDSAVNSVSDSIKSFGWQQPIVVDGDYVIIAGHTRFLAAKKLGMKTVPIKISDNLTTDQIKAFRILDNKLNELTTWDDGLLEAEMALIEGGDLEAFKHLWETTEITQSAGDIEFLNDMIDKENSDSVDSDVIGSVGDYVTMSFVMSPQDRDLVLSALRNIQNQEKLDNVTQALIKITKEFV